MADTQRSHENNKSSLFEKLPPDLLRAVNVAIVERRPPTFRAVWMQFELANFGVSYTAFYRYARRLRDRVNLAEAAGLAAEDDPGVDDAIQKLADRLLELLLNTDGAELNPEIIALLASHHQAARLALHHRRLDEHARLAQARLDLDRDHLRVKSRVLESALSLPAVSEGPRRGGAGDGVLALVDKVRRRPSSLAPAASPADETEPRPSGSAERASPHEAPQSSREPCIEESSIPHSEFRIPTSPNPVPSNKTPDDQSHRALAESME